MCSTSRKPQQKVAIIVLVFFHPSELLQTHIMADSDFFQCNKGTLHYIIFPPVPWTRSSKVAAPQSFLCCNRRKTENPWRWREPAVFIWEEVLLSFFEFPPPLGSHYYPGIPSDIFMTLFILIHGSLFVLEQPSKKKILPSATLVQPMRCFVISSSVTSCNLANFDHGWGGKLFESSSGPQYWLASSLYD